LQGIGAQNEALASLHEVDCGDRRQRKLNVGTVCEHPVVLGEVENDARRLRPERRVVGKTAKVPNPTLGETRDAAPRSPERRGARSCPATTHRQSAAA